MLARASKVTRTEDCDLGSPGQSGADCPAGAEQPSKLVLCLIGFRQGLKDKPAVCVAPVLTFIETCQHWGGDSSRFRKV